MDPDLMVFTMQLTLTLYSEETAGHSASVMWFDELSLVFCPHFVPFKPLPQCCSSKPLSGWGSATHPGPGWALGKGVPPEQPGDGRAIRRPHLLRNVPWQNVTVSASTATTMAQSPLLFPVLSNLFPSDGVWTKPSGAGSAPHCPVRGSTALAAAVGTGGLMFRALSTVWGLFNTVQTSHFRQESM